jgi:hypothetical protein
MMEQKANESKQNRLPGKRAADLTFESFTEAI